MNSKIILIIDNETHWLNAAKSILMPIGWELLHTTNPAEAKRWMDDHSLQMIVIADHPPVIDGLKIMQEFKDQTPQTAMLILAQRPSVERAVAAMKHGALDYFIKPLDLERLREALRLAGGNGAGNPATVSLKPAAEHDRKRTIVTHDPTMQRLLKIARQVAPSPATVLIQGESGTGKELFARYIHSHSDRAEGPFVAVNCASLPEGLLESELFGHEKGSFTGAIMRKLGKFELAHGGTMLLDEISEMHTQLQAKLLRALQEGEIDRVGGRQPIAVNVRVIATTNRDLPEAIENGHFREDLYYRLNVINLTLPPLRQRPLDISLLAEYFLHRYAASVTKKNLRFSPSAMAALQKAQWKGNVRELENIVARGVLLSEGEVIRSEDLLPGDNYEVELAQEADPVSPLSIRDMERRMIFKALDETAGNRTHAAKILGISVRTLRNKLNEYKVNYL